MDLFLSVVGVLSGIDCWKWRAPQESESGTAGISGRVRYIEHHQFLTVAPAVDAFDRSDAFPTALDLVLSAGTDARAISIHIGSIFFLRYHQCFLS